MKQWISETLINFEELLLPANVDHDVLIELCDPTFQENLLVYGPPGTGKSVLCSAIAAKRCGANSLSDLRDYVWFYDCKNKNMRQSVNGQRLLSSCSISSFNDCGAMFIFDEIDELTEGQQKELTEFINAANRSTGVTILATTNVNLNIPAEAKRISPALLSRFSYKQFLDTQVVYAYVQLVQRKLLDAKISLSTEEIIELMDDKFNYSDVSFRDVRSFVNLLIRRQKRQ